MTENSWSNNPKLYGPGCVLNAYGVEFEPELFLSETTFEPASIVFTGKLDFPEGFKEKAAQTEAGSAQFFETVFLTLLLSDSEESAIQVRDAKMFFKRYADEVLRLSNFSGLEQLSLAFHSAKNDGERLPDEIEKLVIDCGVTVIQW